MRAAVFNPPRAEFLADFWNKSRSTGVYHCSREFTEEFSASSFAAAVPSSAAKFSQ
jgi:hypothetical protein